MKRLSSFVLLLIVLWLPSCNKENIVDTQIINLTKTSVPKMVLGKQLENPYSTENMRKAFYSLSQPTKASVSDNIIQTTHLYVKFIPKTEDELSLLKTDSTLVLFQHPLDYEILSYGSYREQGIPDDQPTPLYASVPVGKSLPSGVETVILDELYIPEEIFTAKTKSNINVSDEFVDALVAKSFELTGNEYEVSPASTKGKSDWVPQGLVVYYDDVLQETRPIEGLQVRCNRWFTTYTAYTDSTGKFQCQPWETFKNPANYSIVYERYDFEIRDGWLSTAKYDGTKQIGDWNVDFTGDDVNTYYSTIFRAAYKYYYGDIHGLSRPPQNGFWKTQVKIRAHMEENDRMSGFFQAGRRFLGLGSAIHIYSYTHPESQIYGTTIHELAHATHWGLYQSDYNNANLFVVESWSTGVQAFITRDEYPRYGTCYWGSSGNYDEDNFIHYATCAYTAIIRDLMDTIGQYKNAYKYYEDGGFYDYSEFPGVKSYVDSVSGYTMPQIEQSLNGARDAISWENNLNNNFENETENHLHDAFAFWSTK